MRSQVSITPTHDKATNTFQLHFEGSTEKNVYDATQVFERQLQAYYDKHPNKKPLLTTYNKVFSHEQLTTCNPPATTSTQYKHQQKLSTTNEDQIKCYNPDPNTVDVESITEQDNLWLNHFIQQIEQGPPGSSPADSQKRLQQLQDQFNNCITQVSQPFTHENLQKHDEPFRSCRDRQTTPAASRRTDTSSESSSKTACTTIQHLPPLVPSLFGIEPLTTGVSTTNTCRSISSERRVIHRKRRQKARHWQLNKGDSNQQFCSAATFP